MDRAAFVRLMGPMNDILKRHAKLYAKYEHTLLPSRHDLLLTRFVLAPPRYEAALPTAEEAAEMERKAMAGDLSDDDN